jgi:hypothetical protein
MTRVVIVGEIYNADLSIGGGPMPGGPFPSHPIAPGGPPPGYWGGVAPPRPDQGLPQPPPGYWGGVAPPRPDQGLPQPPPGYWGGVAPPYPDQGLPGGQGGVPTHPWVPPEGETLPPPPDEIVNQYVMAVWNPTKAEWTVTVGGATPK